MRIGHTLINSIAGMVLPRTTAAAACTESFVEKRCQCTSCGASCGHGKSQSRVCKYCNGVKQCAGWLCGGGCTKNCPC